MSTFVCWASLRASFSSPAQGKATNRRRRSLSDVCGRSRACCSSRIDCQCVLTDGKEGGSCSPMIMLAGTIVPALRYSSAFLPCVTTAAHRLSCCRACAHARGGRSGVLLPHHFCAGLDLRPQEVPC